MVGLKKYKEESDVAAKKLKKKMVELRWRVVLAKKLAVYEFKDSKEYKKAIEERLLILR